MSSNKPGGATAALKSTFIAPDGKLRAFWRLMLTMLAWYALSALAILGISRLLMLMLGSWGVTGSNLHLAPGWVRNLVAYQTSVYHCAASVVAAIAGRLLTGRIPGKGLAHTAAGALLGFFASIFIATALAVLFILTDSMRAYTYSAGITADTFISLAIYAVTALAEGFLAFGYVRGMAASRGGRFAGYVAGSVMFAAMSGSSADGALGGINLVLMALTLCFIAEKAGVWPVIGVRAGWLWAVNALAGFTGSGTAMLRLYPVSENILTGGTSGPESGFMVTFICGAVVWLSLGRPIWREIKRRWKAAKAQRNSQK